MTNELRHTPKLRLLSAFLAAAMTLTTLPAAAFATNGITSDLSVAGTSVTANNATDILGDGTAKYEGSVLTLSGEISVPQNETGIEPVFSITIDGTGKLTGTPSGTDKTGYGILPQADKAKIAAGADITLENFKHGLTAYGVDVSGTLTIRDVNYGVSGQGVTVESGGKLIIQNAENAVSGSGANVYGTLEIDKAEKAVDAGGVTVHEGGVVTVTGATSGLNGGSAVNGGSLSVSAETCIDNGAVTFTSGTLKLDSTNNETIALNKLTVTAADFWYRTAKDGAWTSVTGGSWTRPDGAAYFEITTDDPAATHYTVTFDLNGGTNWGKDDEWIRLTGGEWNNAHDQVSFTTQTGGTGEGLSISVDPGMGPKREGYTFVGWYTAANGGEQVENQPYYMQSQHLEPITDNITLYAHWHLQSQHLPCPQRQAVQRVPAFRRSATAAGPARRGSRGSPCPQAAGLSGWRGWPVRRCRSLQLPPQQRRLPRPALRRTRSRLRRRLPVRPGRGQAQAPHRSTAAQWCTEQGLLTAEDGAFHPEQKVTKYRVIRIWKQAAAPQQ